MNPKITLTNPTDDELSAAVAEHVAGWKDPITLFAWHDRKARQRPLRYYKERPKVNGFTPLRDYSAFVTESGDKVYCGTPFAVHRMNVPYATSADAVLPLLEKCDAWSKGTTGGAVTVYKQTLSPAQKPSDDIPDNEWMILKPVGHYWNCDNPKPFPYSACIALLRANGVEVVT